MNKYQQRCQEAKKSPYFKAAKAILDVLADVTRILHEKNMSKKDLAEKMDVTPAYITKIMRGNENLSMETIAKIAVALDCEIKSPCIYDPNQEYCGNLYDFAKMNIKVSRVENKTSIEMIENFDTIKYEQMKEACIC